MTENIDKHLSQGEYEQQHQQQMPIKVISKQNNNKNGTRCNELSKALEQETNQPKAQQMDNSQKSRKPQQLQQQQQQQQEKEENPEQLSNNMEHDNNEQKQQLQMQLKTNKIFERTNQKMECGSQRVYKKTSPNCILTLYLPTREIIINGNNPATIHGLVFVDPSSIIEGCRIFAQLTLTFRYGREDEEVMGLRFCNEAIMSLHQLYPQNDTTNTNALTPLQEALQKRLGETAYPFTLNLTSQAPPSVQLIPAKRYYGAPIGTSYDVRCFTVDKSDDKFHRKAFVKMGIRVIIRSDMYVKHDHCIGPENYASLSNNSNATSPTETTPNTIKSDGSTIMDATNDCVTTNDLIVASLASTSASTIAPTLAPIPTSTPIPTPTSISIKTTNTIDMSTADNNDELRKRELNKSHRTERSESFVKLKLSPKSFRFSGRFGRSKSEVEKAHNSTFYNYSKSFQEINTTPHCSGGPEGAIDKPFLLQDGRVGLKASLDKSWYAHGEEITVTIHICNDSRKTVRKIRVCAIQHVDVCMFNNGKFKNVVADTDIHSPTDRVVAPGDSLSTTVKLKPQRGTTKNWLALEDSLQRSTEPSEISGDIAASALRTPQYFTQTSNSPNYCYSPAALTSSVAVSTECANITPFERNVFAIYVSYYVKVKLTLSGIGGELSLKLPFILVHLNEEINGKQFEKLTLDEAPLNRKFSKKSKNDIDSRPLTELSLVNQAHDASRNVDSIEYLEEGKFRKDRPMLKRCLTTYKNIEEENLESLIKESDFHELRQVTHIAQVHNIDNESKHETAIDKAEGKMDITLKNDYDDVIENKEELFTKTKEHAT